MDPANPSGFYRLDLAAPHGADLARRLFAARAAGVPPRPPTPRPGSQRGCGERRVGGAGGAG